MLVDKFPSLSDIRGCVHGFIRRVPGIPVGVDREEAMKRLADTHRELVAANGCGNMPFVTAEQVHGGAVAVVDSSASSQFAGVDGLITALPGVCLGIYVADCCPVFLADRHGTAIGLVHSGKKGSEAGIVARAIERMCEAFSVSPADLVVQLGPCIRPPHYDIDFAATIRRDAREAGAGRVEDCGTCTGADTERYYSYRVESGKTGRMLAFLARQADPT